MDAMMQRCKEKVKIWPIFLGYQTGAVTTAREGLPATNPFPSLFHQNLASFWLSPARRVQRGEMSWRISHPFLQPFGLPPTEEGARAFRMTACDDPPAL